MSSVDLQKGKPVPVMAAAVKIGVHYSTLYRWIQDNKVAFVEFGGTLFIPLIEVERLAREEQQKVKNRTAGVISTG